MLPAIGRIGRGSTALRKSFVPSLVFPANVGLIDMDFVNNQFAINGVAGNYLPDGTNTDDGRLLRGQISPTQPNFLEQSDGSLKTYTATLATIRRSNLFGAFCGVDITNQDLQSRSFNNASWTAVGCTVAKNATGRTGVANSCCTITLTATTATLTLPVSSDAVSKTRIAALEGKQTVGSGGVIALSVDNAATFPALTVKALAGAGALGFNKYRFTAAQVLASPQKQIKITGTIGDQWVLDFSETLDTGTTNTTDVTLYEHPPIATTTVAVQNGRDRPSAGAVGYNGNTIASPAVAVMQAAVQAHYIEFWQRRDGGLIVSAGGIQIQSDLTIGTNGFGLQSGPGKLPTYTSDLRSPIKNKLIMGQKAGESFMRLNDGALVTGAGGSLANASDHFDWNTNGAALLRTCGGMFRHVMTADYDSMKALAVAGATF